MKSQDSVQTDAIAIIETEALPIKLWLPEDQMEEGGTRASAETLQIFHLLSNTSPLCPIRI